MISKARVTCQTCHTTLVLPDDAGALAVAMTEFVDRHQRMQHWDFELVPPQELSDSAAEAEVSN